MSSSHGLPIRRHQTKASPRIQGTRRIPKPFHTIVCSRTELIGAVLIPDEDSRHFTRFKLSCQAISQNREKFAMAVSSRRECALIVARLACSRAVSISAGLNVLFGFCCIGWLFGLGGGQSMFAHYLGYWSLCSGFKRFLAGRDDGLSCFAKDVSLRWNSQNV